MYFVYISRVRSYCLSFRFYCYGPYFMHPFKYFFFLAQISISPVAPISELVSVIYVEGCGKIRVLSISASTKEYKMVALEKLNFRCIAFNNGMSWGYCVEFLGKKELSRERFTFEPRNSCSRSLWILAQCKR